MIREHSEHRRSAITHETRRRLASTVLTAVGCLLLGACGSGSTTSAATATQQPASTDAKSGPTKSAAVVTSGDRAAARGSDPCSVLTQADVETAVGQPLGAGKPNVALGNCVWSSADFSAGVDITVSTWLSIKNAATAGGTKAPPPAVPGIGDTAFWAQGFLYVQKGDAGFLLSISSPAFDSAADKGLAQAKVLAAAVLGRL